jgi:hypothetical protein
VMLVGRTLVMTTGATAAGRVRVSAYLGTRRLGSCVIQSPADRSFTCRVKLASWISRNAPVSALASLRVGGHVLLSPRRAAPAGAMKMNGLTNAAQLYVHGHLTQSWQLICSPSLSPPTGR